MRFFQVSEDFREDGEPVFAVWNGDECWHFPRWDEESAERLARILNELIESEWEGKGDDDGND